MRSKASGRLRVATQIAKLEREKEKMLQCDLRQVRDREREVRCDSEAREMPTR